MCTYGYDVADLLVLELLGEHVVAGATASPEVCLTLRGVVNTVLSLLLFFLHGALDCLSPLLLHTLKAVRIEPHGRLVTNIIVSPLRDGTH